MKREHILALHAASISIERNTLVPVDSFLAYPQKVIIGHREHLDNKLNNDGRLGDYDYRQAIGYAVVTHPDKGILAFRRKGTEERLDGLISVGFGGHVSVSDLTLYDGTEEIDFVTSTVNSMARELAEELELKASLTDFFVPAEERFFIDKNPLGVISCDKTDVDCLHIGVAFDFRLNPSVSDVSLGDHGSEIFWIDDIESVDTNDCEEWTKIILKDLKTKGKNGIDLGNKPFIVHVDEAPFYPLDSIQKASTAPK